MAPYAPPEVDANPAILALDFGGTKLSAALFDADRLELVGRRRRPAPPTAQEGLAAMLTLAHDLLAAGRVRLLATGVSFGGPVDSSRGVVLRSWHVRGWEDARLASLLADKLGAPAAIGNDAGAGALGEWRFGGGSGTRSLFYATVSTGVGGGLVLDGRLWDGHDGLAGEIGHLVVEADGPPCACGRNGCVEAFAAGPGIARAYGAPDARKVAEAARAGDPAAVAVLGQAGRALGLGLRAVIAITNPQRVVVGGGVAKSGPALWEPLRQTVRAGVPPGATVDLAAAALGDDAPLWGALALGLGAVSR